MTVANAIPPFIDRMRTSFDPETIRGWALNALLYGLYRSDGVARSVFNCGDKIHMMTYIPGIAWAMYYDVVNLSGKTTRIGSGVFVHPDHRHKGIGRFISDVAYRSWNEYRDHGVTE